MRDNYCAYAVWLLLFMSELQVELQLAFTMCVCVCMGVLS